MRTLAIGDIHGCFDALVTLVEQVPITADDLVITLGDHIDRGPKSREVMDWLVARHATGRLISLTGNHELMMLEAAASTDDLLIGWKLSGGAETLRSYSNGRDGSLSDVPAAHWSFIRETCRPYYETDSHFFVHANAYADTPIGEQPDYMLYWEKFHARPAPHESGKTMICGHTPQLDGRPLNIGHAVCIDTGACKGGWLTALDVETGRYWQANEAGAFRAAWLDGSCNDK